MRTEPLLFPPDDPGGDATEDLGSSELIPRATVAQIVRQRDLALERYGLAYEAMVVAADATALARKTAQEASRGVSRYNYHSDKDRVFFLGYDKVVERDKFMAEARRLTDTDVWANLIVMTDMERLMDKKAKDAFNEELVRDPPEVTVENVYATIQQLYLDADEIFKRGIAECFSNLDRRFRSHDGWKIGSRVILTSAFDEYGSWSYYRNHRDSLIDIERTFCILDGGEQPETYAGIVAAVDAARGGGWGRRQSEVDTEFFLLRCYKNGNCHVWFKRDDLVERVNKLLGEYYGDVIPEDREPDSDEEVALRTPKTALAKNCGFFPTPPGVVDRVVEAANLYRRPEDPRLTVLEPSAGTGCLALAVAETGAAVDCVEVDLDRAKMLQGQGVYRHVTRADFLRLGPVPAHNYDRVVMNPPFDRERDIDHVVHALKFLKPEGLLVAVMSAGTEFRTTKKSTAFREMVERMNGRFQDLPARSFAEVGTNVNTVVIRVWADKRRGY